MIHGLQFDLNSMTSCQPTFHAFCLSRLSYSYHTRSIATWWSACTYHTNTSSVYDKAFAFISFLNACIPVFYFWHSLLGPFFVQLFLVFFSLHSSHPLPSTISNLSARQNKKISNTAQHFRVSLDLGTANEINSHVCMHAVRTCIVTVEAPILFFVLYV